MIFRRWDDVDLLALSVTAVAMLPLSSTTLGAANLFAFQPVTSRGNTDRGGAVVPPCRANSRSGVVTNTQG